MHINVTCNVCQLFLETYNILKTSLLHIYLTFSIQSFTWKFSAVVRTLFTLNAQGKAVFPRLDRRIICLMDTVFFMVGAENYVSSL